MDTEKLTVKSQEALSDANNIAVDMNHQEISALHLMLALIRQKDGFIATLITKSGASISAVEKYITDKLAKVPSVSGHGVQTYMSRHLVAVLNDAQRKASQMKDEYISVEHLFLALIDQNNDCKEVAQLSRITKESLLDTLRQVRGNQRVNSKDPEATFDALAKYARNLTDLAKAGKLDPVIGRDD